MPTFHRNYIESTLGKIYSEYQEYINDLKPFCDSGKKILNVGCDSGYETIALMWFLKADEVIGLDKDLSSVQSYALQLKHALDESIEAFRYSRVPKQDGEWWENEVPEFLRNAFFPEFAVTNISLVGETTLLAMDPFDLIYCSNVICHIHTNQGYDAVKSAIESIYEIAQLGGWFVASEPDDEELDHLLSVFKKAGFETSIEKKWGKNIYQCKRYN